MCLQIQTTQEQVGYVGSNGSQYIRRRGEENDLKKNATLLWFRVVFHRV